jgi:preprotein translocase subunit SecB
MHNEINEGGLTFDKLVLEKVDLEIDSNVPFPKGESPASLIIDVSHTISKEKRQLKLNMNVDLSIPSEEKHPVKHCSLVVVGYFSMKGSDNLKKLEDFSEVQGPALMFPFMRETLSNLTMRAGLPPLLLPPTNIWRMVGRKPPGKKTKQTEAAKKA